jgi:hypothetical protein
MVASLATVDRNNICLYWWWLLSPRAEHRNCPQKVKIVITYCHDDSLESSWGALSDGRGHVHLWPQCRCFNLGSSTHVFGAWKFPFQQSPRSCTSTFRPLGTAVSEKKLHILLQATGAAVSKKLHKLLQAIGGNSLREEVAQVTQGHWGQNAFLCVSIHSLREEIVLLIPVCKMYYLMV